MESGVGMGWQAWPAGSRIKVEVACGGDTKGNVVQRCCSTEGIWVKAGGKERRESEETEARGRGRKGELAE